MKFELKAVKHSEFASHETSCFEAKLYVDGKILCGVSNDGQGGCDHRYSVKGSPEDMFARLEAINKELGKTKIKFCDTELTNDLELVVGNLMDTWLIDRDIKKSLKKVCYVKDGGVYTLSPKHKPTPDVIKAVQQCNWWKTDNIILNGKSVEECRQYFNK